MQCDCCTSCTNVTFPEPSDIFWGRSKDCVNGCLDSLRDVYEDEWRDSGILLFANRTCNVFGLVYALHYM